MLTVTSSSGFGARVPGIPRPAFSQVLVFSAASTGTDFQLPDYVNTMRILAWGAGGAGGGRGFAGNGGVGGDGGFVQADIPVTPGTVYVARVARGGAFNYYPYTGGSGGGYSSVELPVAFPARHLVVAGGGGGGGNAPPTAPGTGLAGGPAFADGFAHPSVPFTKGLAATISSGGAGGVFPIGAVPVPILGPVRGPIYGPSPPTTGPSRQANSGGFLFGGGADPSPSVHVPKTAIPPVFAADINGGSPGYAVRPPPAWPGISPAFEPGVYYIEGAGGGGGGYYGGGMGHPNKYNTSNSSFGQAGGGGGASYVAPVASNIIMANTGPYMSNPYYAQYYSSQPPNEGGQFTALGGPGSNPPAFTPPGGFSAGSSGGKGLVVIFY